MLSSLDFEHLFCWFFSFRVDVCVFIVHSQFAWRNINSCLVPHSWRAYIKQQQQQKNTADNKISETNKEYTERVKHKKRFNIKKEEEQQQSTKDGQKNTHIVLWCECTQKRTKTACILSKRIERVRWIERACVCARGADKFFFHACQQNSTW